MSIARKWRAAVVVASLAAAGCDTETGIERLSEARRLSADILVQFTKAADSANLAVMADTDETSIAFGGGGGARDTGAAGTAHRRRR